MPDGRKLLRMNLDETTCKLWYKPQKGNIAGTLVTATREGSLVQDVSPGMQKASLSHMGLICDTPPLQPEMPQFILGNEYVLPQSLVSSLSPTLPVNVHLLRRKSCWVNHEVMAEWALALRRALRPHLQNYQPVLLLDACAVHYGEKFLKALQRAHVWVVFVPAGMTWLMQPCDTHVFAKYKRFLRDRQHERMLDDTEPVAVSAEHTVKNIVLGIRRVLKSHRWAKAFDQNGYGQQQRCVRRRIQSEIGVGSLPDVPKTLLDLPALESIFPNGRTPEVGQLFNAITYRLPRAADPIEPAPLTPPPSPEESQPIPISPWFGRLRSTSRLSIEAALAPEDPPPLPPPAAPPSPCPPKAPPALAAGAGRQFPRGRPLALPRALPKPVASRRGW